MKKLRLKSILSNVTILLIVFSFSCSRSVVSRQRPITDLPGLEKKVVKTCNFISSSNIRLKFQTEIEFGGKIQALSGRLFLLSDTCIFISLMSNSLGIEVGRLIANADSVCLINKIDKTFFSSDYQGLKYYSGLNFNLLYSIFSDSYVNCDSVSFNSSNTYFMTDKNCFVVTNVSADQNSTKSFFSTFFDSFGNIFRFEYKNLGSDFLRVNYSNFALKDGFPGKMIFSIGIDGAKRELEVEYSDFTILKPEKLPTMKTNIAKYKRIYL